LWCEQKTSTKTKREMGTFGNMRVKKEDNIYKIY
jgi:hypothetical protein